MALEKDYSKQVIKEFDHWTVLIHENQGYLGRSVVWAKRPDASDLVIDATLEEREELFKILANLRLALTKSFNPDRFNWSFLGNIVPHLHGHIVPRYAQTREFMGVKFEDQEYGKLWTDSRFLPEQSVLFGIRDQLKKFL